jgi:hypothetical protein
MGSKGSFFPAGFFLVCSLVWIRKTRFVFDATQRIVRWRSLIFLKASTGSIPFDDITDIGIESTWGGRGGSTLYQLMVITSQGSIPIASSYGARSDKYASMRETILTFLKPGIRISRNIRNQ